MVYVEELEHLITSMELAVVELERAINLKDYDKANKLRTFIFDLYMQIDKQIRGG